ncbi:aspartyl-phosphate phosphatase Spo0E family protein [Bacillus sp. FJAT-44742]|uniref:aspartyl-phosphate phosphatase Spo0E family protein n=1 Tax=Bacillus sp. FJAT-44742 TaxID=2014005 RepID=UPI001E3F49FE|nr:aspartyl-phosphate phosphatase Spo0E family protein [Bacillus sp. FJAT-44742]
MILFEVKMIMHAQELIIKIEAKRNQMINAGRHYGLTSGKVLQASQELDELLNLYQNEKALTAHPF